MSTRVSTHWKDLESFGDAQITPDGSLIQVNEDKWYFRRTSDPKKVFGPFDLKVDAQKCLAEYEKWSKNKDAA